MKIALIVLLLAAFLCAVCLFSAGYITYLINDSCINLKQVMETQNTERSADTVELIEAVQSKWTKHGALLGTVLSHSELDAIHTEFARLRSYAVSRDQDDLYSTCAALIVQLENIRSMQWPYWENIM